MKVHLIGGVAGGDSNASSLRGLDEKAEILIAARGRHVSYANCRPPDHVSGLPGTPSARPPLPGINPPGIFQVRTATRAHFPNGFQARSGPGGMLSRAMLSAG